LETPPHLFMGEVVATFEGLLAALHGLDRARFLFEIACQYVVR
jgi:hypothetical protein